MGKKEISTPEELAEYYKSCIAEINKSKGFDPENLSEEHKVNYYISQKNTINFLWEQEKNRRAYDTLRHKNRHDLEESLFQRNSSDSSNSLLQSFLQWFKK